MCLYVQLEPALIAALPTGAMMELTQFFFCNGTIGTNVPDGTLGTDHFAVIPPPKGAMNWAPTNRAINCKAGDSFVPEGTEVTNVLQGTGLFPLVRGRGDRRASSCHRCERMKRAEGTRRKLCLLMNQRKGFPTNPLSIFLFLFIHKM